MRPARSIRAALLAPATLVLAATLLASDSPETPAVAPVIRVGFPAGYQEKLQPIRAANHPGQTLLGTIYANPPAAAVTDLANATK